MTLAPPVYDRHGVQVRAGDCLDVLRAMPGASVHAVVCDPPYGLSNLGPDAVANAVTAWVTGDREHVPNARGFMGREWDAFVPPPAVWDECLRVLKPGGYLLCFSAPRTVDLMGLSIRLAGFEIRDTIGSASGLLAWTYGSGFPKSLNVSRDKRFCQCLPGVRDAVTDAAAESAAQVLLAEVYGDSADNAASLAHLHGVPVALHADYALPGGTEQDVLGAMRAAVAVSGNDGATVEQERADHPTLRSVREASDAVAEQGEATAGDVLLAELSGQGERGDSAGERLRRDGHHADTALRSGQPSLEGRGDVQTAEGQLHRAALREMPAGPYGDGQVGRVRDGTSVSDGPMGRAAVDAVRVREPRGSQPAEQPAIEPGTVADERGPQARRGWPVCGGCGKPRVAPGLGTALKPAWEPIVVARKPITGTVAATVLAHGTGALNIDGCRVGLAGEKAPTGSGDMRGRATYAQDEWTRTQMANGGNVTPASGRWPANVIFTHAEDCGYDPHAVESRGLPAWPRQLDSSAAGGRSGPGLDGPVQCVPGCPVAELDAQSAHLHSAGHATTTARRGAGGEGYGMRATAAHRIGDSGGASRFFPTFRYQAKTPAKERPTVDGVAHPTVKPLDLMRWLVRLVTPPGGTVLDPFAGTGTTGQAARAEGMRAVLIERDADHIELIRARLDARQKTTAEDSAKSAGDEPPLDLLDLLDGRRVFSTGSSAEPRPDGAS